MRLVRCDRCKKEAELVSELGKGFPNTFIYTANGDYCKDCFQLYEKTIKSFNNPPISATHKHN